jgi:hypothetical protein
MSTPDTATTRSSKLSLKINFACGILMLLGTVACLAFDERNTVSKGTMGMLIGTVACLFAASLSYADYQRQKRDAA